MVLSSVKKRENDKLLQFFSIVCFVLAAVLSVVLISLSFDFVQRQLAGINAWFLRVELFIARFDKLAAVCVILLLFLLKTLIPVIPFSVLFIGSGLVLSVPVAASVNLLGFAMLVSLKFLWGRRFGGGGAYKLVLRSKRITKFLDFKGDGNKWMLVFFRFIPFIPVGTVSTAYGGTDISFWIYVFLSVLGFLPRLISWSVLGCNITDPFTAGFIVPIIVLLILSGFSLILLNLILNRKEVNNEKE